ncbi:MAG: bifunctional 5,10-methylene-tetrahydrofolate dehydrogenase/5,10-methylene-tetrahydrofolate cyclohydrolase, partial [Muribaculaceae bacterium]|nr:bifunctional 5,10-methylene-tetrahydrofolate dehydrogenase/5,10-methylene-tetrahydrofolate cyclohydrolase [Muribaculaceae bacterium]
MTLIDGKKTAADIKAEIAAEVEARVSEGKRRPHLAAILVGHDGGSEAYVANKIKACEACGFKSSLIRFESTPDNPLDAAELMAAIDKLNNDDDVDGFIVQLPLPRHIDEQAVIEAINPDKDVDGFHPVNVGRQSVGLP